MPATRTKDSATLRKTHDKSDAMATQSDVRRLLRLPALFASKKAASCCKILANRTQRKRRTTRFCTKENKNTFQKSSAALTTPATTNAATAERARDALPAIAPPIARLTKCGAASENGRRANRESRPRISHRASGRASDRRRRKPGFPGEKALSSVSRREPSRCDASSSAESSKGLGSSSWDLRPKGAYRDAEPKFRVAGASSGSCGRGSQGCGFQRRLRDSRKGVWDRAEGRWTRATHQRFVQGSVNPRRKSGSEQRTLQSIIPRGRHRADVEAKRPREWSSIIDCFAAKRRASDTPAKFEAFFFHSRLATRIPLATTVASASLPVPAPRRK